VDDFRNSRRGHVIVGEASRVCGPQLDLSAETARLSRRWWGDRVGSLVNDVTVAEFGLEGVFAALTSVSASGGVDRAVGKRERLLREQRPENLDRLPALRHGGYDQLRQRWRGWHPQPGGLRSWGIRAAT
jgi:hypothetical protein